METMSGSADLALCPDRCCMFIGAGLINVTGIRDHAVLPATMEDAIMWRSLFLAAGIVLCVLGAECLILEKAVLAKESDEPPPQSVAYFTSPAEASAKEIVPPDWAPWSLLGGGAVVILYSYTVPRRNG